MLMILWVMYDAFRGHSGPRGWASLSAIVLLIGSAQLICLGIIGEYIGRIYAEVKRRPLYVVEARLARWLLMMTDKADERSLPVTHDVLAQMVGGPRHAVTVALNELRAKGAIAHLRGRLEILNRSLLIAHACECYRQHANLIRSTQSD